MSEASLQQRMTTIAAAVCFGVKLEFGFLEDLSQWMQNDLKGVKVLRQHGLDLIIHDVLKDAGLPVLAPLRERARLIRVSQMAAVSTYSEVLRALQAADIPTIVQKGFWLSNVVYPHSSWRTYADLDLLFDPRDLHAADEIIRNLEFDPIYSAIPYTKRIPDWMDGDVMDSAEYRRGVFHVDAHFRIVPHVLPCRATNEMFFADVRNETLVFESSDQTIDVGILSPIDTVLHLALHASYHQMEHGMRALMDIALVKEYFTRNQSDVWQWSHVVQRAKELDIAYLVAGPLWLYHYFFGERRLPESFVQKLDPRDAMRSRYLSGRFLAGFINAPHNLTAGQRDFFRPVQGAGLKKITQAGTQHLFPSPKRMAARYGFKPGDPRVYLKYLTRPIKLAYKYGPRVLAKRDR